MNSHVDQQVSSSKHATIVILHGEYQPKQPKDKFADVFFIGFKAGIFFYFKQKQKKVISMNPIAPPTPGKLLEAQQKQMPSICVPELIA